MEEKTVTKSKLMGAVDKAKKISSPSVDLGPLLNLSHPLVVKVDALQGIMKQEVPTVKLQLGDDKSLTIKKSDGSLMATLQVKF